MRTLSTILIISIALSSYAQSHSLEGVWQGIIYNQGETVKEGEAFWLDMEIDVAKKTLQAESRVEKPYKEYFAYKKVKGKVLSDSSIHFEEVNIRKKKESSFQIWCLNEGDLIYNRETGYLEGEWSSSDCHRQAGKIILFK